MVSVLSTTGRDIGGIIHKTCWSQRADRARACAVRETIAALAHPFYICPTRAEPRRLRLARTLLTEGSNRPEAGTVGPEVNAVKRTFVWPVMSEPHATHALPHSGLLDTTCILG